MGLTKESERKPIDGGYDLAFAGQVPGQFGDLKDLPVGSRRINSK